MKLSEIRKPELFDNGRGPHAGTVVYCPNPKRTTGFHRAEELALENRWIHEYRAGLWYYSGTAVALLRFFEMELKRIAFSLGFEEWVFPRLICEQTARDFGLMDAWPYYLLQVSPMKDSPDSTIHSRGEAFILDPVQCAPFYAYFADQTIPRRRLPVKIVESSGHTYRDETKTALAGVRKTIEFDRTELVFMGSPAQVKKLRVDVANKIVEFLENLGFDWRLVVGNGCYETPSEEDLAFYDRAGCLDEIPILDFEVFDPLYYENKWLEVIGCSMLHDRKIKAFRIRSDDDSPIWSGCVGFGLNRLIHSFLLYHGGDRRRWPTLVQKRLASLERLYNLPEVR